MRKTLLSLIISCLFINCFAATEKYDFNSNSIPDSLKKNAYAVIRFNHKLFEFKSPVSANEKCRVAVTVLDKKGIENSYFTENGNKFIKLSNFRGTVFDSKGEKIKTFNKSDIKTTAYSSHLATDNFVYYLSIDPPSFPFTVYYEYDIDYENGIIIFPVFYPQEDYNLSVQEASYSLQHPASSEILVKAMNIKADPETVINKDFKTITWKVSNLKAIEYEKFAPSTATYSPHIYSAPKKFVYEKSHGEITDAQKIALWQNELNLNRSNLSDETKKKISTLTQDIPDTKGKVEALYNFLGNTTRYESIQLGIGGFQPIPADEVCRTGFGDCKGLSNYLKSMLNFIGIPANYTIIRLDERKKDLVNDFTAFIHTNHIVLQVPLAGDTLWLECTNTKVPFGYIHDGIAGHDAIVCTDKGGYMAVLPDYPDSMNIERNTVVVKLDTDGKAIVNATKIREIKAYDNMIQFSEKKVSDQIDFFRKEIELPNVTLGNIQITETKNSFPSFKATYEWETNLYGSKTGNRLFVPVNTLRLNDQSGLKKTPRSKDIEIINGWNDIDNFIIEIPDGYEIESMPAPLHFKTEFGSFSSEIINTDNKIIISQNFFVKSGHWDVSSYTDFVAFFDKTADAFKGKITLRKKTN